MKKALLILSLIFSFLSAFSQVKGFYTEIKDPEGKVWKVGDVLERGNGFLFSLRDQSSSIMRSKVLKMSSTGEILNEISLVATDTSVNLCSVFPSYGGNDYVDGLAVCTTPNGDNFLLMLRFDDEMNELGRSMLPLPSPDSVGFRLDDFRFLKSTNCLFALLSYQRRPSEKEIKLCKISSECVLTQVERMEDSLVAYVANLFHVYDEPDGFGIFLHKRQDPGSHINTCVLLYDGNLELKRICNINNWYENDGHGNIYCGDLSLYNSMMCPSPDGSYYISSRLNEISVAGTVIKHDQSAVLAKTDSAFHICPQYCIIGHLNDTVEAPSFYRSVDINDDGMVYQCSMQNIQYGSIPYGSNASHLVVTKTDADLNKVWQKRFLKDDNVYYAFQIVATSDGGCLIMGNVYDHNPELRADVFVLKINADGTVGVGEIQEESMAFVYPNPAKETIKIGGVKALETHIYNALGQCVMNFKGNEVNVEKLPNGIYLMRVAISKGKLHTLRFVVHR